MRGWAIVATLALVCACRAPSEAVESSADAAATEAGANTELVDAGTSDGARDATQGPECVFASDCPGLLVCKNGYCDVECITDKDCPVSWACRETRCGPPAASGADAAADAGTAYRVLGDADAWARADLSLVATGTYNGAAFDGRFVYFAPDHPSGTVLRYDTKNPFSSARAWSTFDLTSLDARAKGYRGALFDGRYVYLVPNGSDCVVPRFDTRAPFLDGASWSLFDLATVQAAVGFAGATFDGRYVYFAPAYAASGKSVRLDTQGSFTSAASWAAFSIATVNAGAYGFAGAAFDGRYVYYVPLAHAAPHGVVARYDTDRSFSSAASWQTLDLASLNAKATGFRTAAFDGRYLTFVPGWSAPSPSWSSSVVARLDTQAAFASAGAWSFFDTTSLGPSVSGFNAAAFDGRYLTFAPAYAADGYHGTVLRFDTGSPFGAASSWGTFDAKSLDSNLSNLRGAAFDGQFVYFAPNHGVAARFEARTTAAMPDLPAFFGSTY